MLRLLLPLLACLPLQGPEADVAASPYARWRLGPPTDASAFPLGVWLQDPALAERYAALGINTFVGLWKGPTEEQLTRLKAAGLRTVCAQNAVARGHAQDPTIIGWLLTDEPDNSAPNRAGPRATPAEILRAYQRHRERDPDRPVFLNLGQGVANDGWKGRGARFADYPAYARACDVVSFDVYPVSNVGRSDGQEVLWWVAKGVQRLRRWTDDERIVWNFIETTSGRRVAPRPTPAQVRAEVWLSLVAGSRGIVYFCHRFAPKLDADALLADAEMARAVAAINREVLGLAPILNAPSEPDGARVEVEGAPVGVLPKRHAGRLYLLTVGQRDAPSRARFTLPGLDRGAVVVLGEDRRLPLAGGVFEDEYAPYQVHHYRVEPAE